LALKGQVHPTASASLVVPDFFFHSRRKSSEICFQRKAQNEEEDGLKKGMKGIVLKEEKGGI